MCTSRGPRRGTVTGASNLASVAANTSLEEAAMSTSVNDAAESGTAGDWVVDSPGVTPEVAVGELEAYPAPTETARASSRRALHRP